MTDDYINTYGPYANKLLSLLLDSPGFGRATSKRWKSGSSTSTPAPRG
jgi:hypothetical protein